MSINISLKFWRKKKGRKKRRKNDRNSRIAEWEDEQLIFEIWFEVSCFYKIFFVHFQTFVELWSIASCLNEALLWCTILLSVTKEGKGAEDFLSYRSILRNVSDKRNANFRCVCFHRFRRCASFHWSHSTSFLYLRFH